MTLIIVNIFLLFPTSLRRKSLSNIKERFNLPPHTAFAKQFMRQSICAYLEGILGRTPRREWVEMQTLRTSKNKLDSTEFKRLQKLIRQYPELWPCWVAVPA